MAVRSVRSNRPLPQKGIGSRSRSYRLPRVKGEILGARLTSPALKVREALARHPFAGIALSAMVGIVAADLAPFPFAGLLITLAAQS